MNKFQKILFRLALFASFLVPFSLQHTPLKASVQTLMLPGGNPNTPDISMRLATDILRVAAPILNKTVGELVSRYIKGEVIISSIVNGSTTVYRVRVDGVDIFILDSSL